MSAKQDARFHLVLAGGGRVKLDDEPAPLDGSVCAPASRGRSAGANGLDVLVFGPGVAGDGELVEDFWR